jgi:hypothetical protein
VINAIATCQKNLSSPNIDKKYKFTYSESVKKCFKIVFTVYCIMLLTVILACGPAAGTSTLTTPITPGPQSAPLVNGNISVKAGTNLDYAFTVEPAMKDVSVVGSFQTFGGAPNHIEVYIMDDATYTTWLKGGTAHILLDSGNLSSGDIDQAITTSGKYHLTFTNYASASLSPAQQVTVSFDLKWTY